MAQTPTNLVIGKALVYLGTKNAITAAPADTVLYGTAFGGSWTELGYTKDGATLTTSKDVYEIESDQENVSLLAVPTKEEYVLELNLLEATLTNLQRATGMGTLATSGSTEVLDFGSDYSIDFWSIAIEGRSPHSAAATTDRFRRAFLWKGIPTGDIEVKMAKDGETFYAVKFKGLIDSTKSAGARVMQVRDNIG